MNGQAEHILVGVIYASLWLVLFGLFGLQRLTLLISRQLQIPWRGIGELLLPSWYPSVTWTVRFLKRASLITILALWPWKIALAVLVFDYLLSMILPVPYKAYMPVVHRRVIVLKKTDPDLGALFESNLVRLNVSGVH